MKLIKTTLIVLLALFTTACATKTEIIEKEVPVYVTETVVITVPENLLVVNRVPKPPAKDTYLKADWSNKENLLIKYAKDLEKELLMCVADKRSIKRNIDEKVKLHEKTVKEEAKP